jgi:HSP20 family protein
MITIKGRRILDENIKNEDYFFQECYWGSFSRSIILPMEIDSDRISATLKNGILTIRLPKIDKNRVKKIRIKAE